MSHIKLLRNVPYPLAHFPTKTEAEKMGKRQTDRTIMAVWTGENRVPLRNEWYLSGAIINAYKAANDLSDVRPIAKLVRVECVLRIIEE